MKFLAIWQTAWPCLADFVNSQNRRSSRDLRVFEDQYTLQEFGLNIDGNPKRLQVLEWQCEEHGIPGRQSQGWSSLVLNFSESYRMSDCENCTVRHLPFPSSIS
jgi:hypothetical protein